MFSNIPENFQVSPEHRIRTQEDNDIAVDSLRDFLKFTKFWYHERTGREFVLANPKGRISHHQIMCDALMDVFHLRCMRLAINCPPGASKSEMLVAFCAYAWAIYPDCSFLYVSFGPDIASLQTTRIKSIIELPLYRKLYQVQLDPNHTAKSDFRTLEKGRIAAYGSQGQITGHDAGLQHVDRFSGGLIIDDIHKPDEVYSDTIRDKVLDNYPQTLIPRVRSDKVPIIAIGHRLHEQDFFAARKGEPEWKFITIPAIDEAGNDYNPNVISKQTLIQIRDRHPFVFYSQYQQEPQPAGGSLFKKTDFTFLDEEPQYLGSFITADTAETIETYNDYTVFSHWGIYWINQDLNLLGAAWLNCLQDRFEPKHLEPEFLNFWGNCMRHPTAKPSAAAIEKKSTGVTLISAIKEVKGLKVIEIERASNSGSKSYRHISMQPYIATQRICFVRHAKHADMCITHMSKITANNTHAFDDICDTAYDLIKLAFIDGTIQPLLISATRTQSHNASKLIDAQISMQDKIKGIL